MNEGVPHPDEIVESALLAHVSPPDITYKHHLQVRTSWQCRGTLIAPGRAYSRGCKLCERVLSAW